MIEGVEHDPRGAIDAHVEAKAKPCAEHPWCVLDVGHKGPCRIKPRKPIWPTNYGPRRTR